MTNEIPERELADELAEQIVGEPPAGDANPEDYMSNDQSLGVSPDTGTVYDGPASPRPPRTTSSSRTTRTSDAVGSPA